ncbi:MULTISPECIES: thioredoxin-disulfide reductase [Holospora]|uniref:Thioredoxin reductase n=2 Tax=Holospora TaxID=44747 RepID=A0A061JFR6_9PROT|nr:MULTISPECIES: thioredoxin-disulfide reductase [Holospora]ETZ04536.1 thioredoxin reductase [Holospora undulata HU1]GAJ46115.1 thioredoxin reductase [Holospora elegans E1]
MSKSYHIGIIGSGPAGLTAAIYIARGGFKTTVWAGSDPGGQLKLTTEVENYPGFSSPVLGSVLIKEMTEQAKACGAVILSEEVLDFKAEEKKFVVQTYQSNALCDALIIATGAKAQWLGLESEEKFRGYGVSSCAVCDGRFFKERSVAVIGGGNTAVEEALYLSHQCSQVLLIHRRDQLRAEKVLQTRLFARPNVRILWSHTLEEILGEQSPYKHVTGIVVRDVICQQTKQLDMDGVFIAIGHKPETHWMHGKVELTSKGYIACRSGSAKTSLSGVFAAGDVMDSVYRQAVTAAGFGCMAALDAMNFLEAQTESS